MSDQFEDKTPNPQIIAYLEKYLEMARLGEVAGFALAISLSDDSIRSCFHFGTASFRLFGAMAHLQAELVDSLREQTTDLTGELHANRKNH